MTIEQWIGAHINLTFVHTIACFFGAGLCVYVMQMNGHVDRMLGYSKLAANLSRLSLVLLAVCLMWASAYPSATGWQPWLPDVVIILVVDFGLFMRAITIAIRWNPVMSGMRTDNLIHRIRARKSLDKIT